MSSTAQGFTLIELLIVIMIIGILAAVGIGGFLPFVQRARLDNAAAETGMAIRYAISEARRSNRAVEVAFDNNKIMVTRGTAVLRSVTLPLKPVVTCRSESVCPTKYNFSAPFGMNATDFAAKFTIGSRNRTLLVRGPIGMVTTQ